MFLPEEGEVWAKPDVSSRSSGSSSTTRSSTACARRRRLPIATAPIPTPTSTSWSPTWTGLDRQSAKVANFAKAFGAGVRKFAAMIGKPEAEARSALRPVRPRAALRVAALRTVPERRDQTGLSSNSTTAHAGTGIIGKHRRWLGRRARARARVEEAERRVRRPQPPMVPSSDPPRRDAQGDERPDPGLGRATYETMDAGLLARGHRPAAADARRPGLLGGVAESRQSASRNWGATRSRSKCRCRSI